MAKGGDYGSVSALQALCECQLGPALSHHFPKGRPGSLASVHAPPSAKYPQCQQPRERGTGPLLAAGGLRGGSARGSFLLSPLPPGQVGLLLLSVVVSTQPEAFYPHQRGLLQLLADTLGETGAPRVLFYSLRTLTALAPYLRTDDVVRHWPSHLNLRLCQLLVSLPFEGLAQDALDFSLCLPFFLTVEGIPRGAGPDWCVWDRLLRLHCHEEATSVWGLGLGCMCCL